MRDLGPVLIANRGEIAVRIARSARRLGLETVAVVTEADEGALHADHCDLAVRVASYLDGAELLRAARLAGARSIHPGYGFLSESAAFARAVVDAGLTWIGPPPEAIALMGDKGRAKAAAAAAGVPTVPEGGESYPVVVKAVAGGGGKGMRIARSPEELPTAIESAKREALAAFGDERILIERYVERPRHIEVQVLADRHGNAVHLGERECSLQRRHQKVVEEAPSSAVGERLRGELGAAAVALACACGYEGAGTVEFLTTADGADFFFLEMNTRLQVEHPVTELVYGIDLVEQQLRVAAGEPLSLGQEALVAKGWAIEARVYAENPAKGFLPSTGTVELYREPCLPDVRVDSGIRQGSLVGTSYDPLLAKVVAHGATRAEALLRLDRALATFDIAGVTTNLAFLRALLAHQDIRAGRLDTHLLETVLDDLALETPADLLPAAAVAAAGSAKPAGPWRRRLAEHGEAHVADGFVTVGGRRLAAAARVDGEGAFRIALDGVERRYAVVASDAVVWIARGGHQLELRTERASASPTHAHADSLEAPMPGTVLAVEVADGDAVGAGDVLIVLESMKMEMPIVAPHAGTIGGLDVRPGDRVTLKQTLLTLVPTSSSEAA